MGNPNSFYRFEQGWNAGFYPDNQIVSDLMNEIHTGISINLPSWYTVGVTTTNQLLNTVRSYVNGFNQYPYYGNFTVTIDLVNAPPDYSFTISIKDNSLYTVDVTQVVSIGGIASNPDKIISSAGLNGFVPGAYTGTFDAPLIKEEQKVKEALNVVYMNGSGFFPITYSFDPTTNIATSGLARGANWKLDDSTISRFPAPVNPYENQRTFQLPMLSGDDAYIISIMDRIIQASFDYVDFATSILPVYNSFTMPDGWISGYDYPTFTTYERVQFSFVGPKRKFILVGRRTESTTYTWQRFVSDAYMTSTYDFMANYVETTALPYEPNQAGRWLYGGETFDFEFVEFTSGCYESKEFYAMPAKPGDQWQFNVVDANLQNIDVVDVGLFTEDGEFIQKIGEASIENVSFLFYGMWNEAIENTIPYTTWYSDFYDAWNRPPISFKLFDCSGNPVGDSLGVIPFNSLTSNSFTEFKELFDAIDWPDIIESAEVNEVSGQVQFTVVMRQSQGCFCGMQMVMLDEEDVEHYFINPVSLTNQYLQITQHQASVTIPSKTGCYRMGLYKLPGGSEPVSTDCEITFIRDYGYNEFADTDTFLSAVNALYGGLAPYLTLKIGPSVYTYEVTGGMTNEQLAESITTWANETIPGMVCVWSLENYTLSFNWTYSVPCGSDYNFSICHSDSGGLCLETENPYFVGETTCCSCDEKCNVTFTINASGENIPCGYDYDPIWEGNYVSVFLTTDSDVPFTNRFCEYSIPVSEIPAENLTPYINNWLRSIPGITVNYSDVGGDPEVCTFIINYSAYIPCDTDVRMIIAITDPAGDFVTYVFPGSNTGVENCACSTPPGSNTFYGLYSLSNIINIDASDCFSTILEFWADSNSISEGFEYFYNWKQRIRIGLNGGGEKPIIEESLYRQSNGVHRRPQNKQDLSIDLHTDFFDLETQLAMTDATRHPYFVWNGQSVFVKGDLEVATIQDFTTQSSFETLAQMKFQVLKQGFQPKNSSCLNC